MHHDHIHDLPLPTLSELGDDLLTTTRRQRWTTLSRPFIGIMAYAALFYLGLWWLSPIIIFLIFVAIVTATHDVVHGTLGLKAWQTEFFLFMLGIVLLESGHAYRTTHHQHHGHFPADDDPEGYPAKIGFLGAVLYGPIFLWRLWWWAFGQNKGKPWQRFLLCIEGSMPIVGLIVGILCWNLSPAVLFYVVMAIVGSWVYPLLTVYLPHKDFGDMPLTQTHTLRGRIIPSIFLELTYHLEHHLYPQVPSHHLAELSHRLDPFFEKAGVQPWRVI